MVFVSGDKLLRDYITEKTNDAKNVRFLETLDDLKSLLNAIASEITEEFLQEISPKAKNIFYDFELKDGLYSKGNVYDKISQEFSDELNSVTSNVPQGRRVEDGVILGDQTFIKKDGQTIVWKTEVLRKFKIIHPPGLGALATIPPSKGLLAGGLEQEPTVLAFGRSAFSVEWQHQITTTGKISRPKINHIDFVGNEWE